MVYRAKEPLYFCGDLHCNFQWLEPSLEKLGLTSCSVIFCGDVGLGFQSFKEWNKLINKLKLKKFLKEKKIQCFFIRGNHDDPTWYDDNTLNTPYMKAVSDYSIIQTANHNILCVGGATSMDRSYRKEIMERSVYQYMLNHPNSIQEEAKENIQKIYWENELPVYNACAIDNLSCKIDIICSHTSPSIFAPVGLADKQWFSFDKFLSKDCASEKQILQSVYDHLIQNQHPIKHWFYGHYHYYNVTEVHNVTGHLLDMARDGKLCIKPLEV